jgi:hypothetical protein
MRTFNLKKKHGYPIVNPVLLQPLNLHYQAHTMKTRLLFSLAFSILLTLAQGQGVIIGDTTGGLPSTVLLRLSDTAKGFLVNKLTTAQRNALQNPEEGLQIYNTSTKCLQIYIPNSWRNVVCDCSQPPAQPSSIAGPVQLCPNSTGQVYSIASVSGANSYAWTVPAGASIQGTNNDTSIVVDFTSNSGTVTVQAQNGCGNSPLSSVSVLVQAPDSTFSINPNPTGTNFNTLFTPNLTGQGISHAWLFQNGNPASSSSASPSAQWSSAGTYAVQHSITDAQGCSASMTDSVVVLNCQPLGNSTVTFNYTGGPQSWTVPAAVCSLKIECWGAKGGDPNTGRAGLGGYALGYLAVSPGQTLNIYVGGAGTNTVGGWNGGGGPTVSTTEFGGGGGGTDVRVGGSTLNDRIIVAGGGGGAGSTCPNSANTFGGHGGGSTGGNPSGSCNSGNQPTPGTQNAGGQPGGYSCNFSCGAGSFGLGGVAGGECGCGATGGGGGGWYGGGGSCHCKAGAGGSGYVGGVTNSSMQTGIRNGNGLVVLTY